MMPTSQLRDAQGRFTSNKPTTNGDADVVNEEHPLHDLLSLNAREQASTFNALYGSRWWPIFQQLFDQRRSIEDECGYPDTSAISPEHYGEMYERNSFGNRVVGVMPSECWNKLPRLYETEDLEATTPFEQAWQELGKNFGGSGWFNDPVNGSALWDYLYRVDVASGIGHYGIIFLGFNDGKPLSEPVDLHEDGWGSGSGLKLQYLRVLDERYATVNRLESDEGSSRFGLPSSYSITFNDIRHTSRSRAAVGATNITSLDVHWSRVLHVADGIELGDEVIGVPRQRPIWNNLLDLRKILGPAAEMFYKGGFPGISFEGDPRLTGRLGTSQISQLKDMAEKYQNSLDRVLASVGFKVNSLSPQIADPRVQVDVEIEAICIQLGIPKRIFMGSERGELASSQDATAWDERCMSRRNKYITPHIIVPFANHMIQAGVLPTPEEYFVAWDDTPTLAPAEKAELANKITEAIVKYVQGDGEALIPAMDFMVRILGFKEEEAKQMLEQAMTEIEEREEEERLLEDERSEEGFQRQIELQKAKEGTAFTKPFERAT